MNSKESQIPNPRKPWCKNCKAHTRSYEKVVTESANGGPQVKHEICKECGRRVIAPEHCPEKAFSCVLVLCSGLFVLGFFIVLVGSGDILILGYGLLVVGPLFYFLGLKDVKFARENKKAWIVWAKERGYNENEELKAEGK